MPVIHPKSALATISLLLLLTACKKNDTGNPGSPTLDYYIKFTLDGNDQLFTVIPEGNMNVMAGGKYTFSAGALKVLSTAASNTVSLVISNVTQITTNKTYVNYATTTAGYERSAFATVSYIDGAGVAFNSWGDEYKSSGVTSDSKISFSEITTTNLKGTFSGTSYKAISGTAEKHVLTKGEFNVKRR